MSWTDERVETLKKMWGEGQSASQIAKELGGVTRNAVIGKVHRLGPVEPHDYEHRQSRRKTKSRARRSRNRRRAKGRCSSQAVTPIAEPMTPTPPPSRARRAIIPAGQPLPPQPSANEISPEALAKVPRSRRKSKKISLMELTERTCKWPVGDPATDDFWFCGCP